MSDIFPVGNHSGDNNNLTSRPYQVRSASMPSPASEADDITVLMHYLQVIWKRKLTVLVSALVGLLLGLGISLAMTPMYGASASLEIQDFFEPLSVGAVASSVGLPLGTQVQLITSQTLRERVTARLNGNPAHFPNVLDPLARLRRVFGLPDPAKSTTWAAGISEANARMRIDTPKESRFLIIETRSPHPQAAADWANTIAQEFIALKNEERLKAYQDTGEWLSRAQNELKNKLEQSENRLQQFAKVNGLIITGSQNVSEEKLKQVQGDLASATADRISKEAKYESSLSPAQTEALPEVLDSGPMANYQLQINDLRRQLAELSTTLTPDHYKVQRIQAMIKEVETARDRERKNIINRIRLEYTAAQRREEELAQNFKSQAGVVSGEGEKVVQYNILLRDVETNKKLYEQTLSQVKEASIASAMRSSSEHIVDGATVSLSPQSPSLLLNLGLGLMGGLLCGALFVVVRSSLDELIQVPGTLRVHLNMRELGVIPSAVIFPELRTKPRLLGSGESKKNGGKGSSTDVLIPAGKSSLPPECLELVTWTRKTAVIAEAFRSVMTSILFSDENQSKPQVLVITSPTPQDGKTTVTTNLAIALAEINHRVLLIDADMRLPRLHSIFNLPNTFGLSDFLNERRAVDEYVDEELVRKTHIPNLYAMCAGPARSNPARRLYSTRMTELLERFRGGFDAVLIDSAPVLSVPDARILAHAADGVIVVIRAHRTHQESAVAALRCFEEDGRRVLGTILNDWNPKRSPYGPYGQYGVYSSYTTGAIYDYPTESGRTN
jgi:succinoglycan biosynthesis transport protein ExoP